ncbi:hypothetical protein AB0L86_31210 [Micromonospora musae]
MKQEPTQALRVPRAARRESPPFMAVEEVNELVVCHAVTIAEPGKLRA